MTTPPAPSIGLSVVVPMYNEEQNVGPLVDAVCDALGPEPEWELVLVDDGSRDRTVEVAERLAAADPRVRVVALARNYGQTAAMQAGFDQARGEIVVSMDGDLQNDPADIPRMVETLRGGRYDLVAGIRARRQDKLITRKVPSWIANRIIRMVTGVPITDNGCSLKAYTRELLDRIHLYSDMHRFIPALAASTAGARITEIPVRHHARRFGESKYGLSRVGKVLADLLTIMMIRSFRERPLVMFGTAALSSFLLGLAFTAGAALAFTGVREGMSTSFVFPGIAMLWFELGCYLLMLGLVGEELIRHDKGQAEQQLTIVRELGHS